MRKEIIEQIEPREMKKHDNSHHPSKWCHLRRLVEAKEEERVWYEGIDQEDIRLHNYRRPENNQ